MKTVVPTIEALKKRFQIKKVVFVADRGMVSKANLAANEKAGYEYIIGAKLRNNVEVRDNVLARAGRYVYKRFLAVKPGAVEIDLKRVEADARYDGKYVLRTTTSLPSAEVAEAYRHLTYSRRAGARSSPSTHLATGCAPSMS